MKITIYGSGYVGLVAAACFAEVGHEVLCMDVDENKIKQLQNGQIPIYEPGLEDLVQLTSKSHHLQFTTDVSAAVLHGECQFIAVGTPPDKQGNADLTYVLAVAEAIGQHMNDYIVVVDKSTVPIGTADKVRQTISRELAKRNQTLSFDVVSNPEFLKEGAALEDFRKPDRIVLGSESENALRLLKQLYASFNHDNDRIITMDTRSAELTKYAANAMLATKISFMNEMAHLAEKVGADIEKVRIGIGSDQRIGYHFTHAGCGYGGSCFGKDIQALIHTAQEYQSPSDIIQAVEEVNHRQKLHLFKKIQAHFQGDLTNKVFAVWGLAFKPETDDMRDAPSQMMLRALWEQGATIQAYDPEAMSEAEKIFGKRKDLQFGACPEDVLEGADALVILTEWRIFRSPDFNRIKHLLKMPVIFDGRNIYDPALLKSAGFIYYGIGRGKSREL
ncbi:MAG: UDP-glucose 6-dehydrogenase [Gammaproteobacteria bacterium 39-13]|nr:UDP-glucose/GDP-mannose dehydrogenase family protein [Gammaproteobacteria bacterium]OJV87848.1 MAG: UDP-glucose 6-dehydrogenase [Gammaproteobacteria bacterium 39-13]